MANNVTALLRSKVGLLCAFMHACIQHVKHTRDKLYDTLAEMQLGFASCINMYSV